MVPKGQKPEVGFWESSNHNETNHKKGLDLPNVGLNYPLKGQPFCSVKLFLFLKLWVLELYLI